MKYCVILLALLTFNTYAASKMPAMKKVNTKIEFADDLDFKYLMKAIKRQEAYFNRASLQAKFKFGSKTIKREKLAQTLKAFKAEVLLAMDCFKVSAKETCYDNLNKTIYNKFDIYKPIPLSHESGYKTGKTLFTAYYSPDLEGSYTQTPVYKHPIYSTPKSASDRKLTREQIDFKGKLNGKGLELFYVKESRYDLWLLHVEGGGRVSVKQEDGSVKKYHLSYDTSNKQKFTFLHNYMVANGMISASNRGTDAQRNYIANNPHRAQEIFASSPSYIFFKVTEDEPLGVKNIPLTENRSLATDYRRFQEYGVINFIKAKKPYRENGKIKYKNFSRFFINQDTGGAIKGNARCDLYFGYGEEARLAASYTKTLGEQYFLLLK